MESSSIPPAVRPPPRGRASAAQAGRYQGALIEVRDLAEFFGGTVAGLRRVPRYTSEVLRQAAILVRGSTVIVFAMVTFIGMAAVTFAYFFLRSAGASDYTGLFAGIVMPRAAVPIMFGYVFSAKVGCGLVAEIGAMRINDEIDAFEVEGVNPMSYVVGTRLIGALIFIPIAVTVALLGGVRRLAVPGGAGPALHLDRRVHHFNWAGENLTDNLQAYLNCGSMALFIVVVSCYYGYTAKGGPAGVGAACARSLLVNIIMVHVIATFWVFIFFGVNPNLPIGG